MPDQHYPATIHEPCMRCGLMRFLMRDHGYAALEIDTETLRRVLREPAEDRES